MTPAVALGWTQWLGQGAALQSGNQRHPRRGALPRRAGTVAAAAAENNNAWDTLSVDELQEWEVSKACSPVGNAYQCSISAVCRVPRDPACYLF